MKKVLNKNNLIFILILMTLFNLIMPNISYAATVSINDTLKETIAGWYMISRGLVIGALLILLLVLMIKAAISSNAGDKALLKRMLLDWLVSIILVIFIDRFMIFAINLNEDFVADAEKLGQSISGMQEGQELSLYQSAVSKAYEVSFQPGTVGMILYMMLVYYAYKFTFVYLKRYVNVIVLILIAPVVCGVYGFKKVLTGKSITLKKWVKEFIYNVFLQTLHALMYGSLVGLAIKYSDESESFLGAILVMILFGVIFKVDKLVRKLFNSVGGDTSVAVSRIDSASNNVLNATKKIAGSKMGNKIGSSSIVGGYLTNKFGENVEPGIIKDSIKTDAKAGWLDFKGDFKANMNEVKALKDEIPAGFSGKTGKIVSEEAIKKEEEKMKNAGLLGRAWFALLKDPKENKDKKSKREELRIYLEDKKTKSIEYIKKLREDAKIAASIPGLVRTARKHPEALITRNPQTGEVKLDERYEAVLNWWETKELEERLKLLIEPSLGNIVTSIVLAYGYESLLRAPKLGMLLLAEDNYKKMVHLPIPKEERKTISGCSTKVTPKLRFKTFENTEFEKIVVQSTRENFQGINTLEKVSKGIRNQTITYRKIDETEGRTVIHYKGKSTSCRKMNTQSKMVLEALKGFCSDAQIARNIAILGQLQRVQGEEKLTNLSPELLIVLEQAGVVRKIENGPEQGGYVFLDQAIENVVMNKKINDYLSTNADNPLAQKINQFLINNPDNEIAIKIANFAIDNPDNQLVTVLDHIEVTEDGVVSFIDVDKTPDQVKVESFDNVIGEVASSKGEIQIFVDGVAEDLGEIPVQVLRNEDGSVQLINFDTYEPIPLSENAIVQIITPEDATLKVINLAENTIQTATGENALQILREKGIEVDEKQFKIKHDLAQIATAMFATMATTRADAAVDEISEQVKVESFDNVVGEVAVLKGEVQIVVDGVSENLGEIPVQVLRNEDGSVQLINSDTHESIPLSENAIIQIITPEDATLQVINVAENMIQTTKVEDAVQILKEKGIQIDEKGLKIKHDLTEIATSMPEVKADTTEDISIYQMDVENLTALVQQEIIVQPEEVSEEERLGKLNGLLGQLAEHQGEQALLEALSEESNKVDKKVEEFVYAVSPKQETLKHLDYLSENTDTSVEGRYTADDLTEVVESLKESSSEFVLEMSVEGDDISSAFDSILDAIRSDDEKVEIKAEDKVENKVEKEESLGDEYDSLYSKIMEGLDPEEKVAAAVSSTTSEEKVATAVSSITPEPKASIDDEFESLKNAIMSGISDDSSNTKSRSSWAKPEGKGTPKKGKKGKKDEKSEPPVKIKFKVEGAVKKPGEYWLTKGNKIYQAIKLAGGFAKNADQESISNRLDEIIDENNTFIRVPVMTEEKLKAKAKEKAKGKESKTEDKNKIECIITGAVENPGKRTLEKGATVADLILAAGRLKPNANRQAIMLNGEIKVHDSYQLSDKDKIFIPEITEEELDARKGYDTKYIKYLMEIEFEEYRKRVEIESIDTFRRNKGAVYTFSKKVSKTFADKGIKMSFDEIERRVEAFLKRESEKELKKAKSKTDDLLRQINVVKKSQVTGRAKEFVERLDTRHITIETRTTKARKVAEHIEQVNEIKRTEGVTN